MNKKLAVIVLTWNDWKNTIECLESIFNNSFENFDIILVDNNSDLIHIEKINQWSKSFIKVILSWLVLSFTSDKHVLQTI